MDQYSTIIPTLRYKDAKRVIEWLCRCFNFELKVMYEENGTVVHAQLTYGSGMIMVSSARDTIYDQLITDPLDISNSNTQSPYIWVNDIKAHYDHVYAQGAEIVIPYKEEDHGTGYSCKDPEGHLWNFGDYNPWLAK